VSMPLRQEEIITIHKNMLPEIVFRNSWIYDMMLKPLWPKKFKRPTEKVYDKVIKELEIEWKKTGRRILKELAAVTKLKWHEKEIVAYITVGVYPFSDPLTLNLYGDTQHRIDVLTHELVHRILSDRRNWPKYQKNWNKIIAKYKNEAPNTKHHIVIHAIHEHILRKFYDENRLDKETKSVKDTDYKKSWQIVKKEGYKNIIANLTKT
jgi:hypothetical protein